LLGTTGFRVDVLGSLLRYASALVIVRALIGTTRFRVDILGGRLRCTSVLVVVRGLSKALIGTISPIAGQDILGYQWDSSSLDGHDGVSCLKLVLIVTSILWWRAHVHQIIIDLTN